MLLPGVILAGEAKILSMSGNVEARQAREGQWVPASENMEIPEGGAVRTGADGAAVMLLPNKTKVWLKETSNLELEQRQTLASRLALVFGRIKVRVPHLMRKEKFEVRTPSAVCAVRGTEFTMGTTEEGKMDLQVLFGEVKMKFMVPSEKGKSEFSIPQGQGLSLEEKGKPAKPALLTAAKEREAMENWNPGVKPEDRQKGLQQKENDRAQVKEFARVTNKAENTVKSFLNVVKESDLEAGRTLTDVHGNMVRVDQRMIRPDPSTIQFMNLVKRPTYVDYAKALKGFKYNGGAVSERLDLAQMSMGFNKDLPQRIDEWPSFFSANEVNPTYASFVMANRTNAGSIFFVAEGYRYDATRDELVDNLSVFAPNRTITSDSSDDRHTMISGVLADDAGTAGLNEAQDMLNAISRLQIQDTDIVSGLNFSDGETTLQYKTGLGTYTNFTGVGATNVRWGMAVDETASSGKNYEYSVDGDNAPLYQYRADAYAIGNKMGGASPTTATNGLMSYAREDYVIDNGGKVQRAEDITNSSLDPFTLLKNIAVQSVVYVKQSATNDVALLTSNDAAYSKVSNTDYFSTKNIDVVLIPDLFVAGVQRMLPALTDLGD
jgi:hypothetical protein